MHFLSLLYKPALFLLIVVDCFFLSKRPDAPVTQTVKAQSYFSINKFMHPDIMLTMMATLPIVQVNHLKSTGNPGQPQLLK